jgi:hypothetical protein
MVGNMNGPEEPHPMVDPMQGVKSKVLKQNQQQPIQNGMRYLAQPMLVKIQQGRYGNRAYGHVENHVDRQQVKVLEKALFGVVTHLTQVRPQQLGGDGYYVQRGGNQYKQGFAIRRLHAAKIKPNRKFPRYFVVADCFKKLLGQVKTRLKW